MTEPLHSLTETLALVHDGEDRFVSAVAPGRGHVFGGFPWLLPAYIWTPGEPILRAGTTRAKPTRHVWSRRWFVWSTHLSQERTPSAGRRRTGRTPGGSPAEPP